MPMDRERYPDDWEAIAYETKAAADWCCEHCDRQCRPGGISIARWLQAEQILGATDLEEKREHPQRWTLTTAHLDHDPENPNARLAALCSVCHRKYDGHEVSQTKYRRRRDRLEKAGQMTIEGV